MRRTELRLHSPMLITLDHLRRYAVARTFFTPTTLPRAIRKLGFVQADPIRAPARAQDLTLRHRVKGYAVGDLERRYAALGIEEDFFVNYGFLLREHPLRALYASVEAQARPRELSRGDQSAVGVLNLIHPWNAG